MLLLLCATTTWSPVLVGVCWRCADSTDYRTISGVNGPLVVLENVKVGAEALDVMSLGTPFFGDRESASRQRRVAQGTDP